MKKTIVTAAAAALITMGIPATAYAAGWTESSGSWQYVNSDNSLATDQWKKSGDQMYYLDSDGNMLRSRLIEDGDHFYYVDSTGAMAKNVWKQLDSSRTWNDDGVTAWYYFQNNGRAMKNTSDRLSLKEINDKRYAFDENGRMLTGWVSRDGEMLEEDDAWTEAEYYLGGPDDGAAAVGWLRLEVDDDREEDFDGLHWFYFDTHGKKYADTTKTINGYKYTFDEYGAALSGWQTASDSDAELAGDAFRYYNKNDRCWLTSGWFYRVPGQDLDEEAYDADEAYWFYASKNGDLTTSQFKTINGKKYAFNDKGEMFQGLYLIGFDEEKKSRIASWEEVESEEDLPDEDDARTLYFFGDSPAGAVQTGKKKIQLDGETIEFCFEKNGAGTEGIDDGSLYIKGRLMKAESGEKYVPVSYKDKLYLVNTSGKLVKNKKNVKDGDDVYYCTNKQGEITYSGDSKYTE